VNQAIDQINATASLLVPEIVLLGALCAMFLFGPMLVGQGGEATPGLRHRWGILSVASLAAAWTIWFRGSPETIDGALFRVDELVWYVRGLSLSAGVLLALALWNQIDDGHAAEAQGCLLAILAGTSLVAAADDLVSLFLALELVSIPTYLILYLPRRDRIAREAAMKYFLLSIFSSALVLYGLSWLYGIAGSTNFTVIAARIGGEGPEGANRMVQVAFAMLLAGLSFRIAAVPFHFYAPDVFQGTTASNAALLSFVPKVVGFVALLRLLPLAGATDGAGHWLPNHALGMLLAVLAVGTMFVGNLMALRQSNLYRLMAYSSIAHAGYMLVGLSVGNANLVVGGTQALLFYLAAYGLMTIGVFALLSGIQDGELAVAGSGPRESQSVSVNTLRGLSRTQPAVALMLAVCLFSLTGLPPTAGFLGKLNLFLASWSEGSRFGRGLAIAMAVNAAIAAWYYLRVVALMFLEPATQADAPAPKVAWPSWLAGAACTAATVGLFFAPQWLWNAVP
jgi:NADH-quinone oxidoreductase subunit N